MELDGILVIRKPEGMTSFDVIARLRKKYKQKKFGHTGTLDPMASGVLVVMAGKACKILPYIQDTDKEYIATLALGSQYDTDDVFGTLEKTQEANTAFDADAILASFKGKLHQRVPKASAKKVNGKKLYDYLRADQEVPEIYSDVEVYDIERLEADKNHPDDLRFRVACSSGTYIRSICRDFGEKTGNLAAMTSLVRTEANGFTLDQADDLDAETHRLYPIAMMLDYPKIQAENLDDIRNGKKIRLETDADRVLMMDGETALAIYDRMTPGRNVFASARGLW